MQLLSREPVGYGQHRSGWPVVMAELEKLASGQGVLLDDFTDASFTYKPIAAPHRRPWVGIFHHPVMIRSPLASDNQFMLRRIAKHAYWEESRKHICGAIALCEDVGRDLRDWLNVPVLVLKHPTVTDVPAWNAAQALKEKQIVQLGYCFRNTQAIAGLQAPGWRRLKLLGSSQFYIQRDRQLAMHRKRPTFPGLLQQKRRLADDVYDDLLTRCVTFAEFYGTAANNAVVECMVRGTPLITNRLPALEEYLGRRYPLFYSSFADVPRLLTNSKLQLASEMLLDQAKTLPSFSEFAREIANFVDGDELGTPGGSRVSTPLP